MIQLEKLAAVRSGLVLARKQARGVSEHRYPLLNLKCVQADGRIDTTLVDVYDAAQPLDAVYLTQLDDVLVRMSSPYTAVLIGQGLTGMVISSNFVIIRTDATRLIPAYLLWLLGTPDMKKRIFESTTGNMIAAVKPSFFGNLALNLPDINAQKRIGSLHLLAQKEGVLLHQLAEAKQAFYAEALRHHQSSTTRKNTTTEAYAHDNKSGYRTCFVEGL